jgi:CBS domain-containing protein
MTSTTRRSTEGLGFYSYKVRDVMIRRVATIAPGDSLAAAARLMSRRAVSGLPVVSPAGKVLGVLSEKDLLRKLPGASGHPLPRGLFDLVVSRVAGPPGSTPGAGLRFLETTNVRSTMTMPAIVIAPGASLDEAVRSLLGHQINRLPVVDRGKLVGIVTRHDLLSGLTPEEPIQS